MEIQKKKSAVGNEQYEQNDIRRGGISQERLKTVIRTEGGQKSCSRTVFFYAVSSGV